MAAATGKVNWFAIWTSIIVAVIAIGIGASVIVANNMANDPGTRPTAEGIDQETGAVSVGTGKDTVDTYIDFMCPVCNGFEEAYGEQLQTLAKDGDITLKLHPVAILNRMSQGTNYSTRAANAFYCVADTKPDAALDFMGALFKNQPQENTTGLSDEQLVGLAKDAGADIQSCQADAKYEKFVTTMTKKMPTDPTSGNAVTPSIVVNGTNTPLSEIGASQTYFTDKFSK